VTPVEVLDEGVTADPTLAVRSSLSPRIGFSPASVVGFDPVVGVLGCVVKSSREELHDHPHQAWARSAVISDGSPWEAMADKKNLVAAFRSRFLDKNTSMT
jgi:hypothetical protein